MESVGRFRAEIPEARTMVERVSSWLATSTVEQVLHGLCQESNQARVRLSIGFADGIAGSPFLTRCSIWRRNLLSSSHCRR